MPVHRRCRVAMPHAARHMHPNDMVAPAGGAAVQRQPRRSCRAQRGDAQPRRRIIRMRFRRVTPRLPGMKRPAFVAEIVGDIRRRGEVFGTGRRLAGAGRHRRQSRTDNQGAGQQQAPQPQRRWPLSISAAAIRLPQHHASFTLVRRAAARADTECEDFPPTRRSHSRPGPTILLNRRSGARQSCVVKTACGSLRHRRGWGSCCRPSPPCDGRCARSSTG
jgi:hypothetical protein